MTLKTPEAIQSTLRSVEIHSERCYKISICSVSPGQPSGLFEITRASVVLYYFPENFRCNLSFYERENFSDPYLNHIFESENFRFPSSTKDSIPWGVKCQKLSFRKS